MYIVRNTGEAVLRRKAALIDEDHSTFPVSFQALLLDWMNQNSDECREISKTFTAEVISDRKYVSFSAY